MRGRKGTGIGDTVRRERERHGLTREAVAELAGVSPHVVAVCEGPRARTADVRAFRRVCRAIGVDGDTLLEGCGYETVYE